MMGSSKKPPRATVFALAALAIVVLGSGTAALIGFQSPSNTADQNVADSDVSATQLTGASNTERAPSAAVETAAKVDSDLPQSQALGGTDTSLEPVEGQAAEQVAALSGQIEQTDGSLTACVNEDLARFAGTIVNFDTGSSELSNELVERVKGTARIEKPCMARELIVTGHASPSEALENEALVSLGMKRAQSVSDALVSHGVIVLPSNLRSRGADDLRVSFFRQGRSDPNMRAVITLIPSAAPANRVDASE